MYTITQGNNYIRYDTQRTRRIILQNRMIQEPVQDNTQYTLYNEFTSDTMYGIMQFALQDSMQHYTTCKVFSMPYITIVRNMMYMYFGMEY